jgi:hypothetical protein
MLATLVACSRVRALVLVSQVVAEVSISINFSRKEDLDVAYLPTCTSPDPCLAKQYTIDCTAQPARLRIQACELLVFDPNSS